METRRIRLDRSQNGGWRFWKSGWKRVEKMGKIRPLSKLFENSGKIVEETVEDRMEGDQCACRFLMMSSTISFSRGTCLIRVSALLTA